MTSTPRLIVAAAAVAVVALAVVLLRPGRQQHEAPAPTEELTHAQRLRERLQQLKREHQQMPGMMERSIEAHSSMRGTPQKLEPRPAAPGSVAQHGPQPGNAERGEAPPDDADDVPALKKIVLENPDPDERLAAVVMLGTTDDPEAVAVLAQALSDQNEDVRMAALESLSDVTGEPPVDAIENALNDSSPDIRFEALSILGDVAGDRARSAIERALHDPDEDVRNLAESLLSEQVEAPAAPTPAAP